MTSLTVIFDIDGVIVDSERLHFEVLQSLLHDQVKNYTPQQLIGLSLEETLIFVGVPQLSIPQVASQIVDKYIAMLSEKYLRPGVSEVISRLDTLGINFGFVSTAPRRLCIANLALLGLSERVNLIGGDDIARTKPFPDPYLAMLKMLNAQASNTVVIEDTDLGISSASDAGIKKIYAWPHALSGLQDYKQATKVITCLSDVTEFTHLG